MTLDLSLVMCSHGRLLQVFSNQNQHQKMLLLSSLPFLLYFSTCPLSYHCAPKSQPGTRDISTNSANDVSVSLLLLHFVNQLERPHG